LTFSGARRRKRLQSSWKVSSKAQENGEGYALDQAMNAAERVAANPRSR
jgi:hypothetical protein